MHLIRIVVVHLHGAHRDRHHVADIFVLLLSRILNDLAVRCFEWFTRASGGLPNTVTFLNFFLVERDHRAWSSFSAWLPSLLLGILIGYPRGLFFHSWGHLGHQFVLDYFWKWNVAWMANHWQITVQINRGWGFRLLALDMMMI
jgi:hypothetical protein